MTPVHFTPHPPTTPYEWRRRVEAANEYEPLTMHALNVAFAAAALDAAVTAWPMSRTAFAAIRHEFGMTGTPMPTHAELCAAVAELHARRLAAPWWKITPTQLERFGPGGKG